MRSSPPRRGSRDAIALVDEPPEEGERRRLAVLTAPGAVPTQAAVLILQVEGDACLDPRGLRRRIVQPLRRLPLRAGQLVTALDLGGQEPAALDELDVVVGAGIASQRCRDRLGCRGGSDLQRERRRNLHSRRKKAAPHGVSLPRELPGRQPFPMASLASGRDNVL